MEQVTSSIDRELVRNYKTLLGNNRYSNNPSSDDEEREAGNVMGGHYSDPKEVKECSTTIPLSINNNNICSCEVINRQSEGRTNYLNMTKKMWIHSKPQHNHDGTYPNCVICLSIVDCRDIGRIVDRGNNYNSYNNCNTYPSHTSHNSHTGHNDYPSIIEGGAKKKIPEDCSLTAISNISQEANKILNFIYNNYKEVENNQPINESMFTHAMQTLKLNILHTDLPRVFEMVIARHKKGFSKNSYIEHPLNYITCHMKDLINPLIAFEKSIEGYSYNELLNNLRMQSANYDANIQQTLPMKFDISTMIHPLFFALFWKQLPAIEGMCVSSDQFQLLKNIHLSQDRIKPSSYNFDLTNARWNEKSPIAFFGVTNVIDTEIKRVLCHVYLKKIIYRLRTGELHSLDSNKLISWLKKVFVFNAYDAADDAEQLVSAFMNLFLIRPIKVFVQDQITMSPNCGYLVNTPIDDFMKECPFIYCETTSQIGGVPYNFMPAELNCLRYDKIKNKAILNLSMVGSRQMIVNTNCQQALTCNGLLPIFTRRKAAVTYRDISMNNVEDDIEYISTAFLNVQNDYTVDGKIYTLSSVLCYHTIKPDNSAYAVTDKEIAAGYYALVKVDNGWIKYNIHSFVGAQNVEDLRTKYVNWIKTRRYDVKVEGPTGTEFTIKPNDQQLEEEFVTKFSSGIINPDLLIVDDSDAMTCINTNCCLLIYAEEYEPYKASVARNKFIL
jgi:hypothetical protein